MATKKIKLKNKKVKLLKKKPIKKTKEVKKTVIQKKKRSVKKLLKKKSLKKKSLNKKLLKKKPIKKTKEVKKIKTQSNFQRQTKRTGKSWQVRQNFLPEEVQTPEEVMVEDKKYKLKALRGMKDLFFQDLDCQSYFLKKATDLAKSYGFQEIKTPILERKKLFEKSTGVTSDVVGKQMYEFTDKSGNPVALRPEFTPSIVRAYIEHGMVNLPQPVKFFYSGPLFRYERPQSGRFRQFYQFGLEVLGSDRPIIDAQIILYSQALFEILNIPIRIQLNSLGCLECRIIFRAKLVKYLKSKKRLLCQDCQKRLTQNPLRILDCKNPVCQNIVMSSPQIIDDICDSCRERFEKMLEYLDEANVAYELNPYLVRGLDYYTGMVFEILPDEQEKKKKLSKEESKENDEKKDKKAKDEQKVILQALGGGGCYDNLVEHLGGRPTPAIGVAFGLERIIKEMAKNYLRLPKSRSPQIFVCQLGEVASRRALRLFEELRQQGFRVTESFAKASLRSQLEVANRLGIKLALILGQQEVSDKTIIIRDMTTGNQEIIDQEKLTKHLRKKLK